MFQFNDVNARAKTPTCKPESKKSHISPFSNLFLVFLFDTSLYLPLFLCLYLMFHTHTHTLSLSLFLAHSILCLFFLSLPLPLFHSLPIFLPPIHILTAAKLSLKTDVNPFNFLVKIIAWPT